MSNREIGLVLHYTENLESSGVIITYKVVTDYIDSLESSTGYTEVPDENGMQFIGKQTVLRPS